MRYSFFIFSFVIFSWTAAPQLAHTAPRTKRGDCGAVLPTSSQKIAPRRNNISYPRTMYRLLRYYRKVFGSHNTNYPVTRLFTLPRVIAYHIKNKRKRSRWSGMNLVYYKRKGRLQIYVICRK